MAGEAVNKFAELMGHAAELHRLTTQPPAPTMTASVLQNSINAALKRALEAIKWLKDNATQALAELGVRSITVNFGVVSFTVDLRP